MKPDEQFGFRRSLSTMQQVLRITANIHEAFKQKDVAATIFLDVAKAFDRVWHEGLLYKMTNFGISEDIVKIIDSFLSGCKFRVRVNGQLALERPIAPLISWGT